MAQMVQPLKSRTKNLT